MSIAVQNTGRLNRVSLGDAIIRVCFARKRVDSSNYEK